MMKLAFVTSTEDPTLIRDDQLAAAPLESLGFAIEPLIWDQDDGEVERFDALIFRSCWNYHRKHDQFLVWMNRLRTCRVPIFNPIELNLWNLNKKYLLELEKKGAPIPKTEWIRKGTQLNTDMVKTILCRIASDRVVIKPAVSLNGHDTYLLQDLEKIVEILKQLSIDRDVIIQEFIPEIWTSGETSLIFFNNEFSHAVRKMPSPNEFRIHSEYGGSRMSIEPHPDLIHQAQAILEMVEAPLLFSRVDLVERDKSAALIELEIIDPMLFLEYSNKAPIRFANAIAKSLGQ